MTPFLYYFWLLLSIAMQVLVFRHLPLFGGVAMVYVIALLKLSVELNRNIQILIGFVVGLLVDIFCNTPGMHTLASTTVMALRMPVLHLFVDREEIKTGSPNMTRIGMPALLRFATVLFFFHATFLYLIESFTLFNGLMVLTKIFVSVLLTVLFLIVLELATVKK